MRGSFRCERKLSSLLPRALIPFPFHFRTPAAQARGGGGGLIYFKPIRGRRGGLTETGAFFRSLFNLAKTMVSVLNKNKNARLESSSTTVRGHADVAYEQAPLFGRVKRVSRERASKRRSREGPRLRGSLRLPK